MVLSTSTSPAPPSIDTPIHPPPLTFTLPPGVPTFGPRVGRIAIVRGGDGASAPGTPIDMDTPNIIVGTARGVVPHFSRDHTNGSHAIRWLNVPFESFLEQAPPIPTLQAGSHPLHRFLGFDAHRQIVSLCLRDPLDTREMPPNGNTHVSANCVRGVKKVTLSDWRQYVYKMQPDIVFALSDIPLTLPPYSQKRITKSIERSAAWVADMLRPLAGTNDVVLGTSESETHAPRLSRHPLNVFVHMAGGTSLPARAAFGHGLRETLLGPEAETIKPLRCLDEGIAGYAFDLAVVRGVRPRPNTSQHQSLPDGFLQLEHADMPQHPEPIVEAPTPNTAGEEVRLTASSVPSMAEPPDPPDVVSLLKASLGGLTEQKPRLVTGTRSPHEMLRLVRDVGIDLFDVGWAMHAANLGIALDFAFPVPAGDAPVDTRQPLGHNLYDPVYARQFGRLADTLVGAGDTAEGGAGQRPVCLCITCSPRTPASESHILHSAIDRQSYPTTSGDGSTRYEKPYSRAYVHHLLRTHEMSAHTFLMAHNLSVVEAFFAGVRQVWTMEPEDGHKSVQFVLEVERFSSVYDEGGELFVTAKREWECVDKARGKGRLGREREKQEKQRNEG